MCKSFIDVLMEGLAQNVKLLGHVNPLAQLRVWLQELDTPTKVASRPSSTGPLIAVTQFAKAWGMFEELGKGKSKCCYLSQIQTRSSR